MKLKSFRVQLFRNIVDSGVIYVENSVTCFVGKNEAGKSAILQALHHLNPAKPLVKLNLLDEYPRWLKKEHEISGAISSAVPITATFDLEPEELLSLNEKFGPGVVPNTVTFSRSYADPDKLDADLGLTLSAFIKPFMHKLSKELQTALGKPATTTELDAQIDNVIASRSDGDSDTILLSDQAALAKEELKKAFDGHPNLSAAIRTQIDSYLPTTFYFSNYSQLRGRYSVAEVFSAIQNGSTDDQIQAAADFLNLAKIAPQSVDTWDFEQSNAELEGISSLLTRRVKEHWHQNDHLKLNVSLETQPTNVNGQPNLEKFLQFRVEDTRHDFSSRLDRRSTGFQWFVSFIASFLDFEADSNLILLLDEPGLSLHARAQMDLLDTIENRLAANRQVLYTTHSPFLVRVSELNHARITEDQGPELGSLVINDAGAVTDPDTLFPLQAALGYDIAQSIFIGNQNVLVEGISDFIYITTISDYLEGAGRAHLPIGTRLLPAGGASNIPTFIALIGNHLEIVVILDGNTDSQRIANSISKGRLEQSRILQLDNFCTMSKADIEDMFEPQEYLNLYNGAFGASVSLSDLVGSDRIVKRIERFIGVEFNHGVVGAYFLRNLETSLIALSPATLDRFEKLVVAVNSSLPAKLRDVASP